MDEKKCPVCNEKIIDEASGVCPACGLSIQSGASTVENDIDSEFHVQAPGFGDAENEPAKPGKKVRIITAAVAAVMVLVVALFGWYVYSEYREKDLEQGDIQGVFADVPSGMYFDFKAGEVEIEVPDYSDDQSVDSAASSDGVQSSPEMKTMTFDGTYESGFTKEYVQGVLVDIYIKENEMTEEYQEYLASKKLAADDYLGFAGEKGISQEELDEIDKLQGISRQGESYKENGYWNFDSENKAVEIYSMHGEKVIDLKIVGDAIVDPTGYLKQASRKFKTPSRFIYEEEGYSEEIILYGDGNFIAKSVYEDSQTQYYAGTYKKDKMSVVLDMNGEKMPYTKVKGGISFITYKKK